ncbi:MAG TPA: protein-disulfide reductase DsbD N-terminal domain-containing protein [Gemmatimonadaceae bacterium]|nr:protein-disulfide reductase DsbD N-terminal domain-containing protein [Gemmatimonadaceae bacterium]
MHKLSYILLLPLAAARDAPATPRTGTDSELSLRPVKWSVVGGSAPRQIVSGRTVPLTLQAEIAKGWHIYSLTQKPGGPIPLRIELVGAADVVVRGIIKAPEPERAFDKNFGMETELYSGSPRFTIPVGVPGRSLTGMRKLQIAARYQVCSETLCLPARTDKVDVSLQIRGRP